MTVRLLFLVLLLVNGTYFAWSQGLLRDFGIAPDTQSEPHRMAQQIRPEAIRLLSATEVKSVEAQVRADSAPKECLQAGGFDDEQAAGLQEALAGVLPAGAWAMESRLEPARWIVYMGKYLNAEARTKKRAELAAMGIETHSLRNPALEIGLSLGSYATQEAANTELARLGQRGIRSARVVQEREEVSLQWLKLPALTEAMKSKLSEVKPALGDKVLKKCN